jgi:hypothetical protein
VDPISSFNTRSALDWVTGSLHGAGSTLVDLFKAVSGRGTRREISEFVKQLHEEYVRMEKIGRSEIDRGPRNTRYVWPFIEESQKDFNSHESELKTQGGRTIGLDSDQLEQLSLAYLWVAPRDGPTRPKPRCWSLKEHEELRDLLEPKL